MHSRCVQPWPWGKGEQEWGAKGRGNREREREGEKERRGKGRRGEGRGRKWEGEQETYGLNPLGTALLALTGCAPKDHWLQIERTKGKKKRKRGVGQGWGYHLFNQLSKLQQLMNSQSLETPGHVCKERSQTFSPPFSSPSLLPTLSLPTPSLPSSFASLQRSGKVEQPNGMLGLSDSCLCRSHF